MLKLGRTLYLQSRDSLIPLPPPSNDVLRSTVLKNRRPFKKEMINIMEDVHWQFDNNPEMQEHRPVRDNLEQRWDNEVHNKNSKKQNTLHDCCTRCFKAAKTMHYCVTVESANQSYKQ